MAHAHGIFKAELILIEMKKDRRGFCTAAAGNGFFSM